MKPEEIIARDLKFGPFRTEQFQRLVGDKLRLAAIRFLEERVLPYLTVAFSRMDGSITTYYDAPEFVGRPELTCRFMFELSFHSSEGADHVGGEMIYDASTERFIESPIRPLQVDAQNSPPPLRANAPPPRPGVCPRCSTPVTNVKSGAMGHWSGCKQIRPKPYANCIPVSGPAYAATCGRCGLKLTTLLEGSADLDPAACVWEEDEA